MAKWTTAEIPDQSGRTVIVTGANSGLGAVVSRELARAGANVTMACRNAAKAQTAAREIRAAVPDADVTVAALDLADLESVREFAAGHGEPLDLLVNNAGVMAPPRRLTKDGFESQLGTNHLGHFALTGLLLDALAAAPAARVVSVASGAHRMGKIDFADLQGERRYWRWAAYGQSKLANLLFAFELERRARGAGLELRSLAAHPGYSATNLQFASPPAHERAIMAVLNRVVAQPAGQGALPTLYAATSPNAKGGEYYGPDGFMEIQGQPTRVDSSRAANDQGAARELWEVSERLTGVAYGLEPVPV